MAEGGYENYEDPFDKYGLDKDGYDKDGYDKDGYDEYGYDEYGKDRDGNIFEQGEGESMPLLPRPRTSTSNTRETQRPFKSRVRTSTEREVSFANPSYHVTDGDEMETSFVGIRGSIPKLNFDEELREQTRKYFPNMDDSALEFKMVNERLSVRLIGIGNEKWKPVFNKDGKPSIQFNMGLRKAMGSSIENIIKEKNKLRLESRERIAKNKGYLDRVDISEEVRNTTLKEIEEEEEVLETLNQEIKEKEKIIEENEEKENELIQNQSSSLLKERIKEIFKKYGFSITSVVTAVGVVIGVIVSKLTSGLSSMAKGVANGLKNIGSKLAQILPGMIGAIASFIFKTAGEVLGFLAENAWILVVAVVVYLVESLKKKSKR